MKKQTINQAITTKDGEIEQLLQQCAEFKTQALACDSKAEELSDSDGDIDDLAQEISSQRTKAAIFRKRESSTLAMVEAAKAEFAALQTAKKDAITGGLQEIAEKAAEDLNKELKLLLPLFRRAQVTHAYRAAYSNDSFFTDIASSLNNIGAPALLSLCTDLRDERVALTAELTASV